MAVQRSPWKKVFYNQASGNDTLVHAAPSSGERLGVVKVFIQNTDSVTGSIRLHWGNVGDADYILPVKLEPNKALVIELGSDSFPLEAPSNSSIKVSSEVTFNAAIYGYKER